MSLRCFVGLGSNLAEPEAQIREALCALDRVPRTELQAVSSLYRSPPLGPAEQPDYLNAVVSLHTALEAESLLDHLQDIERAQGRVRKAERWGPRSLDLDILLFGDQIVDTPRLTVPHYHMHHRAFVLYPLAELAPELVMPDGTPLSALLERCPRAGLERLVDAVGRG
ncbi:2-amino-4-hydroxy-6-hydroxymethyldihydropteridinediphosphokinase [Halopseudomonas xinjiangensis]|uniref:2-amino-4-hydroxy-6-hydroxymethyldihydropteridine pyrophosphokinase n=1 Tax=Halopseudomonas xinjiangensis TaxID=487184 RepID=A0A1H1W8K4_9GAMM|nr:2-amino-4-hydroxy-6-hydroxymethyldihydropteridine diphosphokinase [Halopseudomonas xinjiangensis]SDS92499.1 2-amino-4-hydroxy-6-hydroxymethyldihydropteridinediphosphokinase [Halopseudomonas xinjiangensis]